MRELLQKNCHVTHWKIEVPLGINKATINKILHEQLAVKVFVRVESHQISHSKKTRTNWYKKQWILNSTLAFITQKYKEKFGVNANTAMRTLKHRPRQRNFNQPNIELMRHSRYTADFVVNYFLYSRTLQQIRRSRIFETRKSGYLNVKKSFNNWFQRVQKLLIII